MWAALLPFLRVWDTSHALKPFSLSLIPSTTKLMELGGTLCFLRDLTISCASLSMMISFRPRSPANITPSSTTLIPISNTPRDNSSYLLMTPMILLLLFLITTPIPQLLISSKNCLICIHFVPTWFWRSPYCHIRCRGRGGFLSLNYWLEFFHVVRGFLDYHFMVFALAPMSHLVPIIPQTPHSDCE